MSYAFTKLSDVPAVSEFPEGANSIIEANGEIKRCPSSNTPKPLTYDYMPAGYPKKAMGTVTLIEEHEFEFYSVDALYYTDMLNPLKIVVGETYTVKWDGTEYECVGVLASYEDGGVYINRYVLGNMSVLDMGDDTGEPFVYTYIYYENEADASGSFATRDASASHTISVKGTEEIAIPMAYAYMPEGYPKKSVQSITLMGEREFEFYSAGELYYTNIVITIEVVVGETYTVKWDGTEYECVCFHYGSNTALGNPSVVGDSTDTGEPFLYTYYEDEEGPDGSFATRDTSASHTIGVKRIEKTVTPMAEEFLPANTKNTTVFYHR